MARRSGRDLLGWFTFLMSHRVAGQGRMHQAPQNSVSRDTQPEEHTRWNFAIITTEASAFMSGIAWTDPATVLPLFIGLVFPSTILIGLVTVLQRLGWILPQLPMAAIVGHRPQRLPYLRWGVFVGRLPLLAFVLYLWFKGVGSPPAVILFMLLAYFSVALGNGVVAVPWQDIIAKSIPGRIRGRFFGTMQFITAVATIGVGFVVRWMLGPRGPHFPINYTILFTLAAFFITISTVGCWLVREPIRPVLDRPQSLRNLLGNVRPLLRKEPSLLVLSVVALLGFGLSATTPFYIVYGTTRLGVQAQAAGVYIWAATLGSASFSLIWAHLNDRFGPRAVVRGACLCAALAPALALAIPAVVSVPSPVLAYVFGLVFLVAGATLAGMWMGTNNYLLELATHQERPRYIAVFNTLALPGATMPLLIGWLLSFTPFRPVFALLLACGAAAVYLSWRMPLPHLRHP